MKKFMVGPIGVSLMHIFTSTIFVFCDVMFLFISIHSDRIDGRRKRDQLGKSI